MCKNIAIHDHSTLGTAVVYPIEVELTVPPVASAEAPEVIRVAAATPAELVYVTVIVALTCGRWMISIWSLGFGQGGWVCRERSWRVISA